MVEILLVYKKNFESVHDESLDYVTQTLTELITTHSINFDSRPRESVLRADFLGRDLVIVLGGDGTLTSISHNIDDSTPVMGVNHIQGMKTLRAHLDSIWIRISTHSSKIY